MFDLIEYLLEVLLVPHLLDGYLVLAHDCLGQFLLGLGVLD